MTEREFSPNQVDARSLRTASQRVWLVVLAWVLLIGGLQLYAWHEMLDVGELLQNLVALCHTTPAGPLIFIGAAALSPLLLIPAALLGSVAGLCFGVGWGIVYTLIACNLSATITYGLGRMTCRGIDHNSRHGRLIERHAEGLRRRPFLAVILLRLSFLPYDPVNYLLGVTRVGWPQFIVANTLGSLPGVVAIVLAGSSLAGLAKGLPMIDPLVLSGAVALAFLSVGVALVTRQKVKAKSD